MLQISNDLWFVQLMPHGCGSAASGAEPGAHNCPPQIDLLRPCTEGSGLAARQHFDAAAVERILERLKPFSEVVFVGVGGSVLGPLAALSFLQPGDARQRIHFVSSLDGHQATQVIHACSAQSVALVVLSKSFTTLDAIQNTRILFDWLCARLGKEVATTHLFGVSSATARMDKLGVPKLNQLCFTAHISGRFSVWSGIGLPIAVAQGMTALRQFVQGGIAMDERVSAASAAVGQVDAPVNAPLRAAEGDHACFRQQSIPGLAILPSHDRLRHIPAYVQQLFMESLGKSRDGSGAAVGGHTAPIVWGDVGPNAQHSFYQFLHQGTHAVACDLITVLENPEEHGTAGDSAVACEQAHRLAVAHCLAQARILCYGTDDPDAADYCQGGHPVNLIILRCLTPHTMGQLMAFYEYRVRYLAAIWGLNAFDQPGVDAGKRLTRELAQALEDTPLTGSGAFARHFLELANQLDKEGS